MKKYRIMKAFVLILLTAALAAALPVSAGTEVRTLSPVSVNNSRTLNVLFIGNSFSLDTTGYIYDIVKQTGCRICLGVGWIRGGKLSTHAECAASDAQKYTYYENSSGSWVTKKYNKSTSWKLSWIMKRKKWDVIVLQAYSTDAGNMAFFYPEGIRQSPAFWRNWPATVKRNARRPISPTTWSGHLPRAPTGRALTSTADRWRCAGPSGIPQDVSFWN